MTLLDVYYLNLVKKIKERINYSNKSGLFYNINTLQINSEIDTYNAMILEEKEWEGIIDFVPDTMLFILGKNLIDTFPDFCTHSMTPSYPSFYTNFNIKEFLDKKDSTIAKILATNLYCKTIQGIRFKEDRNSLYIYDNTQTNIDIYLDDWSNTISIPISLGRTYQLGSISKDDDLINYLKDEL